MSPPVADASVGADEPERRARLAADVAALAAIARSSASAGERRAARWVAARLREAGLADVTVLAHPGRTAFGYAFGAHALLAAAALARGGPAGAGVALATVGMLERDASGRGGPLRDRPAGRGASVLARVPGADPAAGTVVLLAHHDAARAGLAWHPWLRDPGWRRRLRRRTVPGFLRPLAGAAAAGALAAVTEAVLAAGSGPGGADGPRGWPRSASGGAGPARRAARRVRLGAVGLLVAQAALLLEGVRGTPVPGAGDDASGVAVLLELARELAAAPVAATVVLGSCGAEETGMAGVRALLHGPLADLDPATTLVLGVDTVGSGTPIVAAAEGVLRTHRYPPAAVARVRAGAARAGRPAPEAWRIGGWTDPLVARRRGLLACSLLSVDARGGFVAYHRPQDTPDRVDTACVAACLDVVRGTVEVHGEVVADLASSG